ncbi:MAG: hypothetical protein ACHP9V_04605 [Terriglobales bacterium]
MPHCSGMVKKSIAAALLVFIVAWVEMAMAPMLAMVAGHVHPEREMAEHIAHHHAMPAGHACCPSPTTSKTEDAVLLEFAAGSLPCQDEHRCCFRQGPQSLPAPVSGQRLSQEIALIEIAELGSDEARSQVFPMAAVTLGPPPGLLGMVLRV